MFIAFKTSWYIFTWAFCLMLMHVLPQSTISYLQQFTKSKESWSVEVSPCHSQAQLWKAWVLLYQHLRKPKWRQYFHSGNSSLELTTRWLVSHQTCTCILHEPTGGLGISALNCWCVQTGQDRNKKSTKHFNIVFKSTMQTNEALVI